MAGAKDFIFKEKLSPYIKEQMISVEQKYGRESNEYKALELQYIISPYENSVEESDRLRHYQSDVVVAFEDSILKGVERLYRRTILIEPSSVCAAHCRWCLRGQYPLFTLREEEITKFAKYCGSQLVSDDLREVLITGGDPFMVPQRLQFIIAELKNYAPNIKIIRIGTRVPLQDPSRVNDDLIEILKNVSPMKLEIGTHINHPIELTEHALNAFGKLYEVAFKIYDQSVLLKGVNDNFDTLSELYDKMRYAGIEAHYLFHCIPMYGMTHHRTSVQKGLDITTKLTNSGAFSGRAKPMYTLMTDIGKITLYQGSIIDRNNDNEILVQSNYTVQDFKKRNPSWIQPKSTIIDDNGLLRVWYPDGKDI